MPDEAPPAADVPVMPYASANTVRRRGVLWACGNVGIAWSFVSLLLAVAYCQTYLDCIGHWCGTPVASAEAQLLLVAVPGLAFSGLVMLAAAVRRREWPLQRRLLLISLAQALSLTTPFWWDLRVTYWPH